MNNRKSVVMMMRGLPASGKSTYVKSMMNPDLKRVSKDDLRAMLDLGEYSVANEMLVLDVRDFIIQSCIEKGFDIVVDDTNLNPVHEQALREVAEAFGANFEVIEIKTDIDVCIRRDAERDNLVGEYAITQMAEKYKE